MTAAVSAASAVSQRGAMNGPILARLAVNITSGTTANGSCRLSTTWLRISNCPVAFLAGPDRHDHRRHDRDHPRHHAPQPGRDAQIEKPSITIWPDSVAVMVEFSPQHKSAIANSVGAMVEPSSGARNEWA